jgi:hypothetical protein
MRKLLPITILFIAILSLGIWSYLRIDTTSKELLSRLDTIEALVKEEDWNGAKEATSQLKEEWDEVQSFWSIFLNHKEMDNIDLSISKLSKLIASENSLMLPSELATLRLFIGHIPERESLSLKNIF